MNTVCAGICSHES